MIAITGAAGQLGGRVAARLSRLGIEQRLIVRDPNRAPHLPGAEIAQASSYGDAVAMGRALRDVETLFLVSARDKFGILLMSALKNETPKPYDRLQEQFTAIDAAAAVGVKRIVYLSAINPEKDATFVLARDHYFTEEHIRKIGVSFTFLRMSLYTDHVPLAVSMDGVIRAPAGEGRAAWVTRDDIADVAVAVLAENGHAGQVYDITGPEALTMAETAERLSFATGRRITYQMQTPHEARTLRTTSRLDRFEAEVKAINGKGLGDYEVEVMVTHFLQIAAGELSNVRDTVPRLTGHQAQSLADYLRQHPESYRYLLGS
jgi:NAD(P)H dehydrogenase (quinone)